MGIYGTKTLLEAVNQSKPAFSFLRDTFFKTKTFPSESVEIDYKKGKRKMAPFVAPRIGGEVVERDGFETKNYKPLKIAPERICTVENISKRTAGENIYSSKTPDERADELLAHDLVELDEMITRREEWMCREVLINGKVTVKGEGIEQELNYNFTNKEELTNKWTDFENSDPIADLKKFRKTIIKKTGKSPNVIVMASDVVEVFMEHPKVVKLFNTLNYMNGTVQPTIKNPVITFIGKIPVLGCEIYSYDEWFIDDTETEQAIMPDGHLIMANTEMNDMLYAAVTQIEKDGDYVTYESSRVPKHWSDQRNDIKMIRLSSRPVPAPRDVDGWYVAVVK